ncbi:hypothetical protein [Rossellomorea marisflavi]|uniref:hypothetical protein n=1 Tax=Rossellomorea marisflavi TaxID=189381 RepID=UPI00345A3B66
MNEIIIAVVVPILTSLISYIGARYQSKSELDKVKEQQNAEIQRIKEQAKNELEKIRLQMDKQAELYEKNAQVDVTKDIMGQFMGSAEGKKIVNQVFQQEFFSKKR